MELSFRVTFEKWASDNGWIHYYVKFGSKKISPYHDGRYVADGSECGSSCPVSISERYVVESKRGEQNVLSFSCGVSEAEPKFTNIILTATLLEGDVSLA